MGMTINEIIAKEKEIAVSFQNIADASSDCSLVELYGDDTEVVEEHLQRCKILADYHNQIANIMYKYQKIEQIYSDYLDDMDVEKLADKLGEVLDNDEEAWFDPIIDLIYDYLDILDKVEEIDK